MMKKLINFGMLAALIIGFSACTKEDVNTVAPDGTSISFSFDTPKGAFQTRAPIALDDEWLIQSLDVYAAVDGEVTLLTKSTDDGETGDYTLTPDISSGIKVPSQKYTISMTVDWIKRHATQVATFYFVGNDVTSTEGSHTALSSTDEAIFLNALTNELGTTTINLGGVDVEQLNLIEKPNNTNVNLLFSAVVEDVRVSGKVQKSGLLRRREARFDIENPMISSFEITEIRVSDAQRQGMIFAEGDPSSAAFAAPLSHVSIPGPANGTLDTGTGVRTGTDYLLPGLVTDATPNPRDSILAPSVFYLYPTELGEGKTEITVMAKLGDDDPVPYVVDASVINYRIQANYRYVLKLNPAIMQFSFVVSDYETVKVPTPAGEDSVVTVDLESIDVTAGSGVVDKTTSSYYITNNGGGTMTFDVESMYGTEASLLFTSGGESSAAQGVAIVRGTPTVTYSQIKTVDHYTVTFPEEEGAFEGYVVVSSLEGDGLDSIAVSKLWGGSADILYVDGAGVLQVGKWGTELTRDNYQRNMPFFQFGSVVGFMTSAAHGLNWDASRDVMFNPTAGVYADYTSIPNYAKPKTAWDTDIAHSPSVSSPDYHNLLNVQAGKGDPCRLVGLTAVQVKSMAQSAFDEYESGWRLPTARESVSFVGATAGTTNKDAWLSWRPGDAAAISYPVAEYAFWTANGGSGANPGVGTFPKVAGYSEVDADTLPASGGRDASGNGSDQGVDGRFWSSTPSGATNGYHLLIDGGVSVQPAAAYAFAGASAVRCVASGKEQSASAADPTPGVPPGSPVPPTLPEISAALTPGAGDLLYFEGTGDNAKLMIGQWGDEITATDYKTKMAFFQMGSLVGFDNNAAWDASAVKFNPTGGDYTNYGAIPNYLTAPSGWNTNAAQSAVVSSPAYHNFANIQLGKGDPCQLIGLTAAQIRDAANEEALAALLYTRPAEQRGWRLASPNEQGKFVEPVSSTWGTWAPGDTQYRYYAAGTGSSQDPNSSEGWVTGTEWIANGGNASSPGVGKFPIVGSGGTTANSITLPAAGNRSPTGAVSNQGTYGYFWTSVPISSTNGCRLYFDSSYVLPVGNNDYANGFAVRCVRPE